MDCSPPGSSVHGIRQARTLEWAATVPKPSSPCKSSLGLPVTALLTSRPLCLRLRQASPPISAHPPFFKVLQTPMGTTPANVKRTHPENLALLEAATRSTVAQWIQAATRSSVVKAPPLCKKEKNRRHPLGLSWQPISCVWLRDTITAETFITGSGTLFWDYYFFNLWYSNSQQEYWLFIMIHTVTAFSHVTAISNYALSDSHGPGTGNWLLRHIMEKAHNNLKKWVLSLSILLQKRNQRCIKVKGHGQTHSYVPSCMASKGPLPILSLCLNLWWHSRKQNQRDRVGWQVGR